MYATNRKNLTAGWKHSNPVHVLAGFDFLPQLTKLVPPSGVLLVTTSGFTKRGTTGQVVNAIGKDCVTVEDQIDAYPDIDQLDKLIQSLNKLKINRIVAIGGGSVVDTAKVLSVALQCGKTNPIDAIFRKNNPLNWTQKIPLIAVPTTSGTGAEVTPFATVWDPLSKNKHSLFNDMLYPEYALLDPDLTTTLPLQETLYTGLDAISHALESLWNRNRTPISELFANQALTYAAKSFSEAMKNPGDRFHRGQMQMSSLLAGMAISQTKTAIAHSISYPLTSHFLVPHGLACGFTLKVLAEKMLGEGILDNREAITSIITLLGELELNHEIGRYLEVKDGLKLASLMFNPERSDNFIRSIDTEEILSILEDSFKAV